MNQKKCIQRVSTIAGVIRMERLLKGQLKKELDVSEWQVLLTEKSQEN